MMIFINMAFLIAVIVGSFSAGYGYRDSKESEAYASMFYAVIGLAVLIIGFVGLIASCFIGG